MYVDWKYKSKSFDIFKSRKNKYFKTYERIVNKNIQEAKRVYYFNCYIKKYIYIKSRKNINYTLERNKKEYQLPTSVVHENRDITDPNIVANMYNDYFKFGL